MTTINFFTPISFPNPSTCTERVLTIIDDYFYWGVGKKACVVHGSDTDVVLVEEETLWLLTLIKVASYFTLVLPLFNLIIKSILRSFYTFKLISPQEFGSDSGIPENSIVLTNHLGADRFSNHTENIFLNDKSSIRPHAHLEEELLLAVSTNEDSHEVEDQKIHTLFHSGQIGNVEVLQFAKRLQNQEASLEIIQESILGLEEELRTHLFEFPDASEASNNEIVYLKMYQDLCTDLAPRKYQATAADAHTDIISEKNEKYANAKDPYDLFRIALHEATQELKIDPVRLKASHFFTSAEAIKTFRLMILNLLLQANIATDDCAGPYVKFNGHLNARYQKPMIVFIPGDDLSWTKEVRYKKDLLSSTTVGCDPEGARRLLKIVKDSGQLPRFRNYLLNDERAPDETMACLYDLIDCIAKQVNDRYGSKITMMKDHVDPDLQTATYLEYTQEAQTPFQVISKSMVWAAQQFAAKGLLNADDLYGGNAFHLLKMLICRKAVFEMLKNARQVDDFHIRFSSLVELELGQFYV
jgi:hypothetical protein